MHALSPGRSLTFDHVTSSVRPTSCPLDYDSVNLASFRTPHLLRLRRLRIRRRALDYDSVNISSFRMPHLSPHGTVAGRPAFPFVSPTLSPSAHLDRRMLVFISDSHIKTSSPDLVKGHGSLFLRLPLLFCVISLYSRIFLSIFRTHSQATPV